MAFRALLHSPATAPASFAHMASALPSVASGDGSPRRRLHAEAGGAVSVT